MFGLDLHSAYTYNSLLALLFVLICCSAALALSLTFPLFFTTSHTLFSFCSHCCSLFGFVHYRGLEPRQWPCYFDYCGPLNVQQLVLVKATQSTHDWAHSQQDRQVMLSELKVLTIPLSSKLANASLGFLNGLLCYTEGVFLMKYPRILVAAWLSKWILI